MLIPEGMKATKNGRTVPAWAVPLVEGAGLDADQAALACRQLAALGTWQGWVVAEPESEASAA